MTVDKHRYDLKDTSQITLVDLQFLAAMGPPGGARSAVTLRFTRHFTVISMNPFSDETMLKIFNAIISTYMKVCCRNINLQFWYGGNV